MTTASGGYTAALHHVILRIAGWTSDETVHVLREWLAQDRTVDVARAVLFAALNNRIPVTREDVATLTDVAGGSDVDLLDVVPQPQMPCHTMSPVHPAQHADREGGVPQSLDLTGLPEEHDGVDRTAVLAAHGMAGFQGLWRTWRSAGFGAPWPPPQRVYLMQVASDDPNLLPAHAAELQAALVRAGPNPQVEVFTDAGSLPPYQRLALGWSALLATADPIPPIQVAGVFDAVDDAGGPGFSGTRPRLDDDERDRVLGYLDAGALVLPTTALMGDVLGDTWRPVVPMGFRTDGQWIWSDATTYFLRHHGIAPDTGLLDHVRDRRHQPASVGAVGLHRAMAALAAEGHDDE